MERRSFLKITALGAGYITFSDLYAVDSRLSRYDSGKYCMQPERQVPVVGNCDVVICGGSVAAVAAAASIGRQGMRVFLISSLPYPGDDICGSYVHLFEKPQPYSHPLLNKLYDVPVMTPLHAKTVLENELLENHVDFLYSSFVSDVLFEETGRPSGIIIANRAGRQAILAKCIIDASADAYVARLAGAKVSSPGSSVPVSFGLITAGNKKPESEKLMVRELSARVMEGKNTHRIWESKADFSPADWSIASLNLVEKELRDLTWNSDQVDAADFPFYIPPFNIKGKESAQNVFLKWNEIPVNSCKPEDIDNLYLLGPSADVSRETALEMASPFSSVSLGEKLGKVVSHEVKDRKSAGKYDIRPVKGTEVLKGVTGEISEKIRPALGDKKVTISATALPVLAEYDVVILGGGTAGACAGISAARQGARTLVVEYLHGLGGTGTMGMIGRYWDGYREGFTEEIDQAVRNMAAPDHPRQKTRKDEWVFDWKVEWYRRELHKAGGDLWFGALGYGTLMEGKTAKGIVVATSQGSAVVLAKIIIDSTGSADLAIAAGAPYDYTNEKTVAIQGAGLPSKNAGDHYNNTDWTFIDDSDVYDITRLFVAAKEKYKGEYDIGKLPQTRERRRIIGEYTITVADVINNRRYADTISFHKSSFDTHGFTIDPLFTIRPPEKRHKIYDADVPLRCLLPKGIDGIIVTGLGASAHRDAMPVIRMQPCLQGQGYAVGYLAATAVKSGVVVRNTDMKSIQEHLVKMGNLPARVLTDKDNFPLPELLFRKSVASLKNNFEGLEVLLTDYEKSQPLLKEAFKRSNMPEEQLAIAQVLAMMGSAEGFTILANEINKSESWDEGWNYTGMGQFGECMSRLDSLIIALGNTKKESALPVIAAKARLLTYDHHFSHFRAIAIAFETIGNAESSPVLFDLLSLPGMKGNAITSISEVRKRTKKDPVDVSQRNAVLKELHLARALYRCGDKNGLGESILNQYANDLHGHYFRHARGILEFN